MDYQFGDTERQNANLLIEMALEEDLGRSGDLTSRVTIPETAEGSAVFVGRVDGIVAGLPVVQLLAERMSLGNGFMAFVTDGDPIFSGQPLARVDGLMRSILSFERTALNFLQRLSGIASLTSRFVRELDGTSAAVLDTRKTTPGWRYLEKYAVRCGGGRNHRIGLHDAVLIKDNHLAWLTTVHGPERAIAVAIASARSTAPLGTLIEVEVDTIPQLEIALKSTPDVVLVDNFAPDELAEAVQIRNRLAAGVRLEVSGGVNLKTIRSLALTGVDRISVGAITHSATALDIGLDYYQA